MYTLLFLSALTRLSAQPFKFYYSNEAKVVRAANDTLQFPFTGGMNAAQFSNIDLNGDGIKDLFVFDRSAYSTGHKHLTFLRSGNKFVYAPQYESVFPEMSEWAKLIDYNGDGKEDLFTEVSREQYQLKDTSQLPGLNGMRVFKNVSDASGLKFQLINNQIWDTGGYWRDFGVPRLPAQVSFSRGDISGIDDIDGDGDIDIVGFNGFDYVMHYYENWTINPQGVHYPPDSMVYIYRDDCWGYTQFDVNSGRNLFRLRQSKDSMPNCGYQFYPKKEMKHAGSSVLFIDLNNDGVKDFVYGDVNFTNLVSMINDRKHNSLGRDSLTAQDTSFPSGTTPFNNIIQPAAYYADIDNDQVKDLLVTTNNTTAAKSVDNVWVYKNNGTNTLPAFSAQGNQFELFKQTIDLGTRSVPVLVDIDKDGDKDLIVATNGDYEKTLNYNDRLVLFTNISSDTTKPVYMLTDTNFLRLSKDTPILNMHPAFGDLNGDGKEDLVIGDANGYLLYYTNQSNGTNYAFQLQSRKYANIEARGYAAPQLVDLNKDGKLDLVIGTKQGIVQYFRNTGTAAAPQFSNTPTIDSLGKIYVNKIAYLAQGFVDSFTTGYATPHVCDLDKDGNYEMLVGCEAGYIYLYTDVSDAPGHAFTRYDYLFVTDSSRQNTYRSNFGPRTAPFVGFLDGDDKPDMLMGNMRGGLHLYASTKRIIHPSTGQQLEADANINVYPNPARDIVYISTENMHEDLRYAVYDEIGRQLDNGQLSKYHSEKTINTSAYAPGLYFIVFKGSSGYSGAKRVLIGK